MSKYEIDAYISAFKRVYADGDYSLYEYTPTMLKPLAINYEPMSVVRRVRFALEYIRGKYKVYYLTVKNRVVGHCVVTPGGRRLKCSEKKDIVIGPYYIADDERGNGYSKTLLNLTLKNCSYDYEYAYDWIEKTNAASIRTTEACGFSKFGELNVVGKTRRLVITSNGNDYIYRRKNPNNGAE